MIRINFNKDNIESILTLLDHLAKIGGKRTHLDVFFRPISKWRENKEIEQLSLFQFKDSIPMQLVLEKEAINRGIRVASGFKVPMAMGYICYASYPFSYVIDSDGNCYKCTIHFLNEMNKIGYIDENGNLKLDMSKIALWSEGDGCEDTKCLKCPILPACLGNSCPAARLILGGKVCPLKINDIKNGLILIKSKLNKIQTNKEE